MPAPAMSRKQLIDKEVKKLMILAPGTKIQRTGRHWTRSDMPEQVGGKTLAKAYRDSMSVILYQDFSGCFSKAPPVFEAKYDRLIAACRNALKSKFTDKQLMNLARDIQGETLGLCCKKSTYNSYD